jgi:methionyl-tRNA formyltransferase
MLKLITILVDNDSWILPYAHKLIDELEMLGISVYLCQNQDEVMIGDVCFILGCTNIVSNDNLSKNKYNLVVHESALPQGKGFAPMSWQIIEGKKEIVVSLIEAADEVDAGYIWLQETINLNGTELHDEWRELQGECSINICLKFVLQHGNITPIKQEGDSSFYKRRYPKDSELDINKKIAEQFNLLRVVDNESYPAYFIVNGTRYNLKISKCE